MKGQVTVTDEAIKTGIESLDLGMKLVLNDTQYAQIECYIKLLLRWNKVFNLTAIRAAEDMLPLHILDSLSVLPYIHYQHCLDVGSGAGLPGIPLAIAHPEKQMTLLDTNGKKTRFMQQAVIELNLKNVYVVHARVEKWSPEQPFDAIISRAFSSLQDFVHLTAHHLSTTGMLYAMKGRYPADELESLPQEYRATEVKLSIPSLDVDRFLIEIKKHD
ncbi:MAG TPA: 16S rRNA (guanine(527)-N(7))-methyltransferase RsmG [Thiothrix sp.]|nr:16S rRNA (guanine(527)-N(7))-methyltransferase RsmG [Thiothrix sp.]